MSDKELQKNFRLSADFNEYIINHPAAMAGIPNSAHIVIIPENDSELAEKNKKMAKNIAQKQHKSIFGAFKKGGKWRVEKLAFS